MKFALNDEYITLQQILKACDVIQSGGQVKAWLAENEVLVNGEPENRRGKKLRQGDVVEAGGIRIEIE
ncbi:S4 domain-containing protein YaaA [Erysipelotrichaceae bacterium RD49]|nr:S4 domain-containing protein YaaA [Erysipelotrichaceae bacterium RD49]